MSAVLTATGPVSIHTPMTDMIREENIIREFPNPNVLSLKQSKSCTSALIIRIPPNTMQTKREAGSFQISRDRPSPTNTTAIAKAPKEKDFRKLVIFFIFCEPSLLKI